MSLRRLVPEDAKAFEAFFASEAALKYLHLQAGTPGLAEEWIARQLQRYEKRSGLCAVVEKRSGAFIGQCGILFQEVDGIPETEVGYHLLPSYWGKGYATEAAMACRDLAFESSPVSSIISIIHLDNEPSQKVALRNGMRRTVQTKWRDFDVFIYRVTRAEWEKR
ncbi:MAG: GNAT family N-acetyltransferase [Bacteroidota bacterium]